MNVVRRQRAKARIIVAKMLLMVLNGTRELVLLMVLGITFELILVDTLILMMVKVARRKTAKARRGRTIPGITGSSSHLH